MFKRVWMQDSPLRRWAIFETLVLAVVLGFLLATEVSRITFYLTVLAWALATAPITQIYVDKFLSWERERAQEPEF
jgi:predicted MFS family arabinose efflux permease